MNRISDLAGELADRLPGVVRFTEKDLHDSAAWVRQLHAPVYVRDRSVCWKWGPIVIFDEALMPGVGKDWPRRLSKALAGRVSEKRRRTIVRAARRVEFAWICTRERDENGGPVELRAFPFVWFTRRAPQFKGEQGQTGQANTGVEQK